MTKKEYLYTPTCPLCGAFLVAGDSGEPSLTEGWWCNDCEPAAFFTQDDLDYFENEVPDDDDERIEETPLEDIQDNCLHPSVYDGHCTVCGLQIEPPEGQ